MISSGIFRRYEEIAGLADAAFRRLAERHADLVRCIPQCADCCHAVFGLFPVEAAYLRLHFDQLDRKVRRPAVRRARRARQIMDRLQERWEMEGISGDLSDERIPCPLLDEEKLCILYAHRPITCRVYGIPLRIQGKARVCWKSGFREGTSYEAFDMDRVQQELYGLSRILLEQGMPPEGVPRSADLLVSVAWVILENAGISGS
ncbi:MAG: YkgJ family cysteine cluster protein [Deltaproteobacteria bacterium]|nr:YkgJ family cysteine cluster protein [Deltaproteobacteria bacterium]MBW2347209.1 YkgJ family cysteine cluster protein [Deltaproteobacteria bacterium]RLB40658.1 MAG: hypothetical protein DRH20_00880 [Deltaproteobacteria bacterium]